MMLISGYDKINKVMTMVEVKTYSTVKEIYKTKALYYLLVQVSVH